MTVPLFFPIYAIPSQPFGTTQVPWEMVLPHEAQALKNHDQTLMQLAERGGLKPSELLAVLEDRKYEPMGEGIAHYKIREMICKLFPA